MDSIDEGEGRRGFDLAEKVLILGVLALIATPVLKRWFRRHSELQQARMREPLIDKSLDDTYPASDPPASQFFDIPSNRH
jgi:hypothetical protein